MRDYWPVQHSDQSLRLGRGRTVFGDHPSKDVGDAAHHLHVEMHMCMEA